MSPTSRSVALYIQGRGEIIKTLGGPADFIVANTPAGCAVIDCPPGLNEHLIRVEETPEPHLVPRAAFGAVLPATADLGSILSVGVPAGAEVSIDGIAMGAADEDGIEIEFSSPGHYLVEVTLWPFSPLRQRITVD